MRLVLSSSLLAAALALLTTPPANAQYGYQSSCRPGILGSYDCSDANGNSYEIRRGLLGEYEVIDRSSGNQRCTVRPDLLGGYRTYCY